LVAGPEEAFHHCRAFLQCLGGDLRHLGPNVRAAATLDLALLSRLVGMVFGMIHGAHVCEAEGISLEQFAALLPAGDRAQTLVQVIHDDAFEVGASLLPLTSLRVRLRDCRVRRERPASTANSLIWPWAC